MTSQALPRLAALVALVTFAPWPDASAQTDRFTGTWVSVAGDTFSVTTMQVDGRFRTEQFVGLKRTGTIDGRWTVRDTQIVWTYLEPRIEGEDANAILSASTNRFTLREKDGSLSTFFRKGVVDPLSPSVLPVAVGTGWILEDQMGEMAMRIGPPRSMSGQECYLVQWIDATLNLAYQSECWAVKEDGVYAVGRHVMGRDLPFEKSYKLISRTPAAGEKWEGTVAMPGHSEKLSFAVGAEEEITTPAGKFRAVPLTLEGELLRIRRWYAPSIGLVREASVVTVEGQETPVNAKNLKRRID